MQKIAIVTQKGGAGKTTLAVCLAVAAREAGEKVFVIDLDPLRSLVNWAERREGGDIEAMGAQPGKLRNILSRLEASGVTLVLVDTPAGDNEATDAAINETQLCLVPTRPNIFDVEASGVTLKKLKARKREHALVLTQCPPQRHSPRIQQGIAALETMGALLTPLVSSRADYQEAARRGLGVTEVNSAGAAAAEMRELWRSVQARLDRLSGRFQHNNAA